MVRYFRLLHFALHKVMLTYNNSCSTVVAESLVEVLLFEHLRLQEMELTAEIVLDIVASGPKYVDEGEVATNVAKQVSGCVGQMDILLSM